MYSQVLKPKTRTKVFSYFLWSLLLFSWVVNSDDSKELTQKSLLEQAAADDAKIALVFENKTIVVEYADDQNERSLGLMYRRKMCDDCGMLFKFDSKRIASIWMKNTYIPLDLAYIDSDGTIIDIHHLEPFNLNAVPSSQPILFALEMNVGWLGKNSIKTGQKVKIQGFHDL